MNSFGLGYSALSAAAAHPRLADGEGRAVGAGIQRPVPTTEPRQMRWMKHRLVFPSKKTYTYILLNKKGYGIKAIPATVKRRMCLGESKQFNLQRGRKIVF